VKIHVEGKLITAEVSNAPLQTVLDDLAARTGVIFQVQMQDNPFVSVNLHRVPLREAVQRIAPADNMLFVYGQNESEGERIKLVRIFPRTNPPPQPAVVFLGTGAVTKKNDSIETTEQALEALAESPEAEVRRKAIELLVGAKNDVTVEALTACLHDSAPEVRIAAIEGLAMLDARSALSEILKALRDSNPEVRQSAVLAVSLLGEAENLKDLKPLSHDKDGGVAAAADIAIQKLSAGRP